jgi:hypothetical protein
MVNITKYRTIHTLLFNNFSGHKRETNNEYKRTFKNFDFTENNAFKSVRIRSQIRIHIREKKDQDQNLNGLDPQHYLEWLYACCSAPECSIHRVHKIY